MSALRIARTSTSSDSKGLITLRVFMIMPGLRIESVDLSYLSLSATLTEPYIAVDIAIVSY